MSLFKIGTEDYSDYINTRSYSVNREEISDSWLDVNRTTHKSVVRESIKGSFTMTFLDMDAYKTMISKLKTGLNSNEALVCSIFVNNTGELAENVELFITVSSKTAFTVRTMKPAAVEVTLTIEER